MGTISPRTTDGPRSGYGQQHLYHHPMGTPDHDTNSFWVGGVLVPAEDAEG